MHTSIEMLITIYTTNVFRYCGATPPTNLTTANRLWIKFNSAAEAGAGAGAGFIAHYTLLHGSALTGSEGLIESPLYPLLLVSPEPFTYTWTITVAPGSKVEVTFDEFDLEHSYSCYYTRLAVHEGAGDGGRELFGDCVYTPGTRIVSSENVVTVILTGENTHYGVKFRYGMMMCCQ